VQGLSDTADASAALNAYEIGNRDQSLADAKALIEGFAGGIPTTGADAELLLKVEGVFNDPFAIA